MKGRGSDERQGEIGMQARRLGQGLLLELQDLKLCFNALVHNMRVYIWASAELAFIAWLRKRSMCACQRLMGQR